MIDLDKEPINLDKEPIKLKPPSEYRRIIDDLIDRALDSQERVLRGEVKNQEEFVKELSFVMNM